jgi:hypothetical protein
MFSDVKSDNSVHICVQMQFVCKGVKKGKKLSLCAGFRLASRGIWPRLVRVGTFHQPPFCQTINIPFYLRIASSPFDELCMLLNENSDNADHVGERMY